MPDGEMPSSAAATRSPVPAALAKVPVAPPPHTHVAYETLLSDALRQWPDGSIRRLYSAEDMASGISFLTGMPNPSMFPFKWLAFGAVNPRSGETEAVTVRPDLFEASLQYLPAQGLAPLAEWFQQFVSTLHSRPIKSDDPAHTEWGVTVGSGIQDLLSTAFRVLLNPGDTVLFEAPTYPGALLPVHPLSAEAVAATIDDGGLDAHALDRQLSDWRSNPKTKNKPFPKCLYTIPVGGNPHGTTATESRKRTVLDVCRRHGLLILEDDAYYFLNYAGLGADPAKRPRVKSYFALEDEGKEQWGNGRVLRFDSFSKILSAGLRIGFASGPQVLIEAMDAVSAAGLMHASGPTMAMSLALLEHWGVDGFLHNADKVATFYRDRRDHFEGLVRTHLGAKDGKKAVAEWVTPEAGMFLWLKLNLPGPCSSDLLHHKALAKGVIAVPGIHFFPAATPNPYCRLSYSIVPVDQMELGLSRLRVCIEETWADAGQPL